MPKAKAEELAASWADCSGCGWRNYKRLGNANPLDKTMCAHWTLPATCGGCGRPLGGSSETD